MERSWKTLTFHWFTNPQCDESLYFWSWGSYLSFEQVHDKTIKMTCVPSEDSDQPGHPPVWSESSVFAQRVAKVPMLPHADSEASDQTGWMPRLICLHWMHRSFCWFCLAAAHVLHVSGRIINFVVLRMFLCGAFRVDPKDPRILAQLISAYSKFDPAKAQRFVRLMYSSLMTCFLKWLCRLKMNLVTRKPVFSGFQPGKTQTGLLS